MSAQIIDLGQARSRAQIDRALADIERDRQQIAALIKERQALLQRIADVNISITLTFARQYTWCGVVI
jgi:alkylhydroperoxidase family enzyme